MPSDKPRRIPKFALNQHTVNLVYPDINGMESLKSLTSSIDWLLKRPPPVQEAFFQKFVAAVMEHPDIATRMEVEALLQVPCARTKVELAVLGASMRGECDLLVANDSCNAAFLITEAALRGASRALRPIDLVQSGRFVVVGNLLSYPSLEARLAGNPLFMPEAQLRSLGLQLSPAPSALLKEGRRLRDEYIQTNPGGKGMTKHDFKNGLRRAYPTATGRTADSIWAKVVPAGWKRSGRKDEH
jgi:hypothetical protein